MVLVLGGTTEGRKAAMVLEEAGKPFYYSTKTGEQTLALHHGVPVNGAMDSEAMRQFCLDHDIRLLVDAAHPFATQLHKTVATVAETLQLPAIRFERIFPERDDDIQWVDSIEEIRFSKETHHVLSALGVQSISRLKPLESDTTHITYRILQRESSIALAYQQGATDDQLCFYHENEDQTEELRRLRPDVLLLKESGLTGGFMEKVEAARTLRISIIALRRPPTLDLFHCVNGEHGLRRAVEQLLPDFFTLKSGLTTGTCATAAAVAALHRFVTGETPAEVPVRLPNGETITVPVGYREDYAFCIKDAGDDPDVTDGVEVRAQVESQEKGHSLGKSTDGLASCCTVGRLTVYAGEGIGRFTLPGFDYPPGEPAVNRVPRQMLQENLRPILPPTEGVREGPGEGAGDELCLILTVPDGTALAHRTFNPRLGIEGGISIIGVSGIVKPFSEEAFLDTIRKCLVVAKASGTPRVVIGSGAKSEDTLRAHYPDLPPQAFVQYGNYVGKTLQMATELRIGNVTLGIMLGKAVKLAAGQLDTHSRRGTFDRSFLRQLLAEAHCDTDVSRITLVREIWNLLPPAQTGALVQTIIAHCRSHCQPLFPDGTLTILLIDDDGRVWQ